MELVLGQLLAHDLRLRRFMVCPAKGKGVQHEEANRFS